MLVSIKRKAIRRTPALGSFTMRRRALRAHPNHQHAAKWLGAVSYLRSKKLWIAENGATPSWRCDPLMHNEATS